jgi:DNA-binding IclR family transcriptional regulator
MKKTARRRTASNAPKTGLRAVDRMADILQCFANSETVSFNEVCKGARLSKSTAHRFLSVLEKRGLVVRNPWSQGFRVGPMILRLGAVSTNSGYLQELAAPMMRELRNRCDETVVLTIRVGDHRVALLQYESNQQLRRRVDLGKPFPIYLGGAGKAMLAYSDPEDRARVLANMAREPITPYTPTDPDLMESELERVKHRGYGVSDNEYILGVISIGAPVFDRSGHVIAALSITGPNSRITQEQLPRYVADLQETSRKLSAQLGYMPKPNGANGNGAGKALAAERR